MSTEVHLDKNAGPIYFTYFMYRYKRGKCQFPDAVPGGGGGAVGCLGFPGTSIVVPKLIIDY